MRSIKELVNLSGRLALVTGGTGYIGKVIIETLAELGANIFILDQDINRINDFAKLIKKKYNVKVFSLQVNLEKSEEILNVKPSIKKHFGSLDILVNNAAFVGTSDIGGWIDSFEKQTTKTWRRALEVNLTSAFELTKICTELLKKSKSASVINMASTYGVVGPNMSLYSDTEMGNPAAYAASKGGLIQLTRWLSTSLAPSIRINAISPGGIERDQPKKFKNRYISRTPLGRMGTEEDLKGVIAFLASDLSAYITGQNILVDGGWTSW